MSAPLIGPSEDSNPGGIYGSVPGQTASINTAPPASLPGPRVIELEGLYRVVQRYLATYMLDGEQATTLEDLRHAVRLVEYQRSLPGEAGTTLSDEEYGQLREDVHAALRPDEVMAALNNVMEWVRDDDNPDSSWEDEAARRLWESSVTLATAVVAFERGRQLPSVQQQVIEAAVLLNARVEMQVEGMVLSSSATEASSPEEGEASPPETIEEPPPGEEEESPPPSTPSARRSRWKRVS
jgi:hypothetical protein